ncbi:hypothetical protein KAE78_11905 [Microbacterium sp. NIBRBAC000506063]|nr:hypothetical protein KAE78_11905 [Microbacterium sp. NIBRBAC000506063]
MKAAYGDGPAREARPRANRGDNLTVGTPYQDTPSAPGAAFGAVKEGA